MTADLQPASVNPLALIQTAIDKGVDAEQLEKLMDLQERWEKGLAAKEFSAALARFQSLMPIVKKERVAEVPGKFSFAFAGYDDINRIAAPILAECGLAVSYTTQDAKDNRLTVTCKVRLGTHAEETTVTIPIPAMSVNSTQQFGAAVSYAKRFSMCAALNIIVSDEDDDAAQQLDLINDEQANEIDTLIEQKGVNSELFMQFVRTLQPGCERVADIGVAHFPKVVDALRRKQKGGR